MWAILAVPKKMQLYKDQLRNKHASFHQEIQPAVKRMLFTQDTETAEEKDTSFRFFMKARHIPKGHFTK